MTPVEELVELVVEPPAPEVVEIDSSDQPVIEVPTYVVEVAPDEDEIAVVEVVTDTGGPVELVVADVAIEVVEVVAVGPQGPPGTGGGGGSSVVNGYTFQNYEKTASYVYVGYQHADGSWFIYRRTVASGARLYASGTSGYSTAWAGRAGLTYA